MKFTLGCPVKISSNESSASDDWGRIVGPGRVVDNKPDENGEIVVFTPQLGASVLIKESELTLPFNVGDEVIWTDPDHETCSRKGTIISIAFEDCDTDENPIVNLEIDHDWYSQVYFSELS